MYHRYISKTWQINYEKNTWEEAILKKQIDKKIVQLKNMKEIQIIRCVPLPVEFAKKL